MELTNEYDQTRFITGMRGYSALAVFLIHSGGMGLRQFPGLIENIVNHGRYGVITFFVLSAFTICMSIDRTKNFSYKNYLIKRFLRIVPLYFVSITVAFFLGGIQFYQELFGVANDLRNLITHITFFNLIDYRYQNSIIGVEWTIPIEFFYYFILPFLFLSQKNKPHVTALILMLAMLISVHSYVIYSRYFTHDKDLFDLIHHFSIFKYAFCFALGIFIYGARNTFHPSKYNSSLILLWIILLVYYINSYYPYQELFYPIWIGVLILLCVPKSSLSKLLFENPIIVYLGEISYSIYLIHFIVIMHWFPERAPTDSYILPLAITIAVSSATYFLIEKPFISLGKKWTSNSVPMPGQ